MNALDAEKLLRRIEVKKLFDQPDLTFTLEEIKQTSLQFIRHSLANNDWRFLNTALKFNDWLRTKGYMDDDITILEEAAISSLRDKCGLNN